MRPTVQYFLESWKKEYPKPKNETEENFEVLHVSVANSALRLLGARGESLSVKLPKSMKVGEAYDRAYQILERWQTWEQSLYEMMANRLPVSSIVEQASRLLDNPFALMDAGMNILARSGSPESYETGTIWDAMTGNNLVLSEFYTPAEMQMLVRETSRAKDGIVVYSPERDPDHTYLSCALLRGDRLLGTIGSVAIHGEFTQAQRDILRCASRAIGLYLENAVKEEANRELRDGHLEHQLSSSIQDERLLAEFYEDHGWDAAQELRLLTVVTTERLSGGWNLHMALSGLRLYFPTAAIALLRDRISMVVPEKEYLYCFEQQRAETELFLRQRSLRCGISNRFGGGAPLTEYHRQSSFAASVKTELPVVQYESVELQHFIEVLSAGIDLIPYCNPVLLEMAQSEKESTRVLVECLDAYLLNGRNISKTARALYVNRNTLIYRLERLEELLGKSLDSFTREELLSLLFSCEILMRERR